MEPVVVDGGCCPFCMGLATGGMRSDKKGRPYFYCCGCGTRAFIHTSVAYETFKWVLSSGLNYARMRQQGAAVLEPAEVANGR